MRVPLALSSAVLLALVSEAPEKSGKPGAPLKRAPPPRAAAPDRSELDAFLQMNPEEHFDLEVVNSINVHALVQQAGDDKHVLHEIVRTAEALIPRVRAETEDPVLVGGILRTKTLAWCRNSPSDPTWEESVPLRWGGIFHESRVPGGRLSRKLSTRLVGLINECVKAAGTAAFLRAGFTGLFRGSATMASIVQFGLVSKRPRHTQEVAQAYLDDLAASPRKGDRPIPLERLSEVARRNGSAEVNITLSELFRQEGPGSLVVLDQRFHPGMSALAIRIVPPKSAEEACTYDLVPATGTASREPDASEETTTKATASSVWDQSAVTKKDWLELLRSLEKRKVRMTPPPRENPRDRESYLGLRDLVLSDAPVRKVFLAVRWKGKPSGLALLCQLLSDGTYVPDIETDADYLEAELDHLDKGHAERRSNDGQWKIGHGWTVVREAAAGNVRTYRAQGKSGD